MASKSASSKSSSVDSETTEKSLASRKRGSSGSNRDKNLRGKNVKAASKVSRDSESSNNSDVKSSSSTSSSRSSSSIHRGSSSQKHGHPRVNASALRRKKDRFITGNSPPPASRRYEPSSRSRREVYPTRRDEYASRVGTTDYRRSSYFNRRGSSPYAGADRRLNSTREGRPFIKRPRLADRRRSRSQSRPSPPQKKLTEIRSPPYHTADMKSKYERPIDTNNRRYSATKQPTNDGETAVTNNRLHDPISDISHHKRPRSPQSWRFSQNDSKDTIAAPKRRIPADESEAAKHVDSKSQSSLPGSGVHNGLTGLDKTPFSSTNTIVDPHTQPHDKKKDAIITTPVSLPTVIPKTPTYINHPIVHVDRTSVTPFLLRVYSKINDEHDVTQFSPLGKGNVEDELQIYTWMDAKLRELVNLIKDVCEEARERNAQFKFSLVFPDKLGRISMFTIGTVHSARIDPREDYKTLQQAKFQIGDTIALTITIPKIRRSLPSTKVIPAANFMGENKINNITNVSSNENATINATTTATTITATASSGNALSTTENISTTSSDFAVNNTENISVRKSR